MKQQQQRTEWTAGPFIKELDGYAIYSGEGLSAIATDPEYQKRIVVAVNSNEKLIKALRGLLEVCNCSNGCAPDDMSCASNFAALALAEAGAVATEGIGPPTLKGFVGDIPIMKINDGKRRG